MTYFKAEDKLCADSNTVQFGYNQQLFLNWLIDSIIQVLFSTHH